VADFIAIEHVRMFAKIEQFAFELCAMWILPEPESPVSRHATAVSIAQCALACGDLALAPENVVALMQAIRSAPGIIVLSDDAATGNFITVHDDEASGETISECLSKATGRLVRKVNSATSCRPTNVSSAPRAMVSSVEHQ